MQSKIACLQFQVVVVCKKLSPPFFKFRVCFHTIAICTHLWSMVRIVQHKFSVGCKQCTVSIYIGLFDTRKSSKKTKQLVWNIPLLLRRISRTHECQVRRDCHEDGHRKSHGSIQGSYSLYAQKQAYWKTGSIYTHIPTFRPRRHAHGPSASMLCIDQDSESRNNTRVRHCISVFVRTHNSTKVQQERTSDHIGNAMCRRECLKEKEWKAYWYDVLRAKSEKRFHQSPGSNRHCEIGNCRYRRRKHNQILPRWSVVSVWCKQLLFWQWQNHGILHRPEQQCTLSAQIMERRIRGH